MVSNYHFAISPSIEISIQAESLSHALLQIKNCFGEHWYTDNFIYNNFLSFFQTFNGVENYSVDNDNKTDIFQSFSND